MAALNALESPFRSASNSTRSPFVVSHLTLQSAFLLCSEDQDTEKKSCINSLSRLGLSTWSNSIMGELHELGKGWGALKFKAVSIPRPQFMLSLGTYSCLKLAAQRSAHMDSRVGQAIHVC
eukprot:6190692-Pleurochrysis_carterae.AAC.2